MKLLRFPRTDEELLYGLQRSEFPIERIRCARELAARSDERVVTGLFTALKRDAFWGVRRRGRLARGDRPAGPRHRRPDRSGRPARAHARPPRRDLGARADRRRGRREVAAARRREGRDHVQRRVGAPRDRAREDEGRVRAHHGGAALTEPPRHAPDARVRRARLARDPRALDVFLEHTGLRYRNETARAPPRRSESSACAPRARRAG